MWHGVLIVCYFLLCRMTGIWSLLLNCMTQKKWQLLPRQKETRQARGWHRTGYASYSKASVLQLLHVHIYNLFLLTFDLILKYFLFLEMKHLESHPIFNPAIKVVDGPQKEKKILPVSEDKEDLSFKLFEQTEKAPPVEKGLHLADKHHLSQVTLTEHVQSVLKNIVNIKHNIL